jgi:hypothetical protein
MVGMLWYPLPLDALSTCLFCLRVNAAVPDYVRGHAYFPYCKYKNGYVFRQAYLKEAVKKRHIPGV